MDNPNIIDHAGDRGYLDDLKKRHLGICKQCQGEVWEQELIGNDICLDCRAKIKTAKRGAKWKKN